MTSRSVMEYTCDYCEKVVITSLDDPEDWYVVFYAGHEEGNFCSRECLAKDFQPAPDAVLEAF